VGHQRPISSRILSRQEPTGKKKRRADKGREKKFGKGQEVPKPKREKKAEPPRAAPKAKIAGMETAVALFLAA